MKDAVLGIARHLRDRWRYTSSAGGRIDAQMATELTGALGDHRGYRLVGLRQAPQGRMIRRSNLLQGVFGRIIDIPGWYAVGRKSQERIDTIASKEASVQRR